MEIDFWSCFGGGLFGFATGAYTGMRFLAWRQDVWRRSQRTECTGPTSEQISAPEDPYGDSEIGMYP